MIKEFTVTKGELAYQWGVSEATLTGWQKIKDDPLPIKAKGKRGQASQYDPKEVHVWYQRYLDKKRGLVDLEKKKDLLDLDEERARLASAQADGHELKNAVTRRELVPIKMLELTLSDVGAQIGSVLESIPLKIKKRFPHLKNQEIEGIKRELVKAQNAASQPVIDFDSLSRVINDSST